MGRLTEMGRLTKFAAAALMALFAVGCFLPVPERMKPQREVYLCRWEDGSSTAESFSEALSALAESSDRIFLERDGKRGEIGTGEEYRRIRDALETEELAALLALEAEDGLLSGLERAALFRRYADRGYYAGEFFAWNGQRLVRANDRGFREVVLLADGLPVGALRNAEKLFVGKDAEPTAKALVGSAVQEIEAREPYFVRGGALYLKNAGKVRLIAALPCAETLEIFCDYADDGALSPCASLKKLSLPRAFEGDAERLFGDSVPENLEILIRSDEYEKIS